MTDYLTMVDWPATLEWFARYAVVLIFVVFVFWIMVCLGRLEDRIVWLEQAHKDFRREHLENKS